jgi:hypothetical protein
MEEGGYNKQISSNFKIPVLENDEISGFPLD